MNTEKAKRRGRPPKTQLDTPDTRDALIRCGMEILTEQGFVSTGIDGVLKRVGIPKGSFYYYFDSKEAFGEMVMARYDAYFSQKLDRWLLDNSVAPLERIDNFMDDAIKGMARFGFKRGCLIGNLCQEVTILPSGFRQTLLKILEGWEQRIADCLTLACNQGDIPANVDCNSLAFFFWIGWEGAVQRARMTQNSAPLDLFREEFIRKLDK